MVDWLDRMRNLFSPSGEQEAGPVPSLEIHVPISPTRQFFTMVHLLAASLQANGGEMADTPIVVTVGEDCEPFDLYAAQSWSRRYPIKWVWLDRDLYRGKIYFATAIERFRNDFKADVVLMLDADMLIMRSFAELIRQVAQEKFFGGVVAHVSPFMMFNRQHPHLARANQDWWNSLFKQAGLAEEHEYSFEHTGWNLMFSEPSYRFCPPYFNLGFLIAPAAQMRKIGEVIYEALDSVDDTLDTFYKCQLAVTLALRHQSIPVKPLAIRYNFPNIDQFRKAFPADYKKIGILHYLARDQFDKDIDLQSLESLWIWLNQGRLTKTNRMLQCELHKVYKLINQSEP